MRFFTEKWTRENVAAYLKQRAAGWSHDGKETVMAKAYLDRCTVGYIPDGIILIFTKEHGYHSGGWWKNPDYERCYHLSCSFRDPETGTQIDYDHKRVMPWIDEFFGPTKNLIWTEPPFSPQGKKAQVWHYRVFYAPGFVAPILPRGEVYSKDWTPKEWLSFSDLQEKLRAGEENPNLK
jgi:hypothetical protein